MKVRAKFICNSIQKTLHHKGGFMWSYKFNVVYGDSEENKAFFAATPSGIIEVNGLKDDLFEVGKEYYVDFSVSDPS